MTNRKLTGPARTLLSAVLLSWQPLPANAEADASATSPLSGAGVVSRGVAHTPEERAELDDLEATVQRFEQQAAEYREVTRQLIEYKYQQKRATLHQSYEKIIEQIETEQRRRRDEAIAKFEAFLKNYPGDAHYTADAMFRLSELYFERSYDLYFQARQSYDKELEAWSPQAATPEPTEPDVHYEPTIAMMQRLITEYPEYRLVDGAYYLLGYCLAEQAEDERAVDVYEEMVARFPSSRFAAEVWTRIGEYYFDANELARALQAYSQVLGHVDSPFYDKAMYKLAWTHYRLADPERAPDEFQKAVATFVELLDFHEKTKAEGRPRGGDLRAESIQYIAICYADEQWGSLEKLDAYLTAMGERAYTRELLLSLGDVYFDQTRYDAAIQAYRLVQTRYPNAPDAPQTQEKIVTAFDRNRDFAGAADARAELTRNYSEGTAWHTANQGESDAIAKAEDLIKSSLYSAALFHHKQAQVHKEAQKIDLAKVEYEKAAAAYGEYLQRFPHDRQLYELTFYYADCLYYSLQFDQAAIEYAKVRDSNADNKFLEDAAFTVVLAYENSVKVAEAAGTLAPVTVLKSTDRPPDAPIAQKEIPALKLKLVDASDRFAAVAPNSEKVPNVLYKAAEIFYVYDHLEEARRRFELILAAYPQHQVAEYASNLVIESHLAEKNFIAVEGFSRQLLERPATPGRREFKGELVKFKTGAMFKLAEELDQKGQYEPAAALYLKMLEENPSTQFADSALNNAAVAYEKVKRFESASKLYERLVRDYPKSPLADTALFRVGLSAERYFDFDKAIDVYLQLVDKYPKSERRADAIYNAAMSLENTQKYERAATQYLRYCQLFPNREDAPKVCFRAGVAYEKMGTPARVVSTYEAFIRKYRAGTKHADRVVEAQLKIAEAQEKLGKPALARQAYEAVLKVYKRDATAESAPFAAQAQFQLVERDFESFRSLKIDGNTKQQKKQMTVKAERLKKVETSYKGVLRFKQMDWSLASLFRIGQLYQQFAASLLAAPCPPEIRRAAKQMGATAAEVCDEYRALLEERSIGIEDKAVEAYESTLNFAREFQVANRWTKQTRVALNKLRPKAWPLQKDAKSFVDAMALVAPPVVGADGMMVAPPPPTPVVEPAPAPVPAPAPQSTEAEGT